MLVLLAVTLTPGIAPAVPPAESDTGLAAVSFGVKAGLGLAQHQGTYERDSEYEVSSRWRRDLAADPVGDEIFGRTNLDLTDCRVSWNGTRLYATLQNAGGGFPVSEGLTFFSYLFGIANPAAANPDTVFALIQTFDQPGIITPGLYRIEGTGLDDLVLIGDITVTEFPAENSLLLSCELSDLFADPVFASWYDPANPTLGVAAFTQRITIFGADEADRTAGGRCYLRSYAVDSGADQLPQLTGPFVAEPGPDACAEVVYSDADAHCPVLAEVLIDDVAYPLFPQTLDYEAPVAYRTAAGIPPIVTGAWSQIVFRFSDNEVDVVTAEVTATPAPEDLRTDPRLVRVIGSPNPASGPLSFRLEVPSAVALRLTVHDLAGREVAVLVDGFLDSGSHAVVWDGRDGQGRRQPAGVYFYRLQTNRQTTVRSITLIR